jgi:hypothetical protein
MAVPIPPGTSERETMTRETKVSLFAGGLS